MKVSLAIAMLFAVAQATAQTIVTNSGTYLTSSAGNTQFVTQVSKGPGTSTVTPVMTAPATGATTYVTPTGTYMASRVGSTTYIIQTGRTGGRK